MALSIEHVEGVQLSYRVRDSSTASYIGVGNTELAAWQAAAESLNAKLSDICDLARDILEVSNG